MFEGGWVLFYWNTHLDEGAGFSCGTRSYQEEFEEQAGNFSTAGFIQKQVYFPCIKKKSTPSAYLIHRQREDIVRALEGNLSQGKTQEMHVTKIMERAKGWCGEWQVSLPFYDKMLSVGPRSKLCREDAWEHLSSEEHKGKV